MNAVTTTESTALAVHSASSYSLLMDPNSLERLERVADLMFTGRATVPQHLRQSKGDCFAVVLQSMQWGMNPFAVAQKTHISQSGALGYEAQLISAALTESGALKGDPEYEFIGDWNKVLGKVEERKSDKGGKYYVSTYTKQDEAGLGVICRATLKGESKPRELMVMLSQCYPRFSTQWATDPKQQICYVAVRKWGRLHKPGVLLGVYTPEELEQSGEKFMGIADEVGSPQREDAEKKTYPQTDFAKNVQTWAKLIASKRQTWDAVVATAETKGDLTAEQKQALKDEVEAWEKVATDVQAKEKPSATPAPAPTPSAPAPAPVAAPSPAAQPEPTTLETLAAQMREATSLDELYPLGDLIDTLPAEDQVTANNVFTQRQNALGG